MTEKELLQAAVNAAGRAYAPYSHFQVGAALLTANGRVYTGCNIENASYSPTCCAERTAFFAAVAAGERDFTAIAVAGGPYGECTAPCPPCGVCRQVMAEFCAPDFRILLGTGQGLSQSYTLEELLPGAFRLSALTQRE